MEVQCMRNYFSEFHPSVILVYFLSVITFTILFNHPILSVISFLSSFLFSSFLGGIKTAIKQLLISLPTVIIFALITPLFNHRGEIPVLYINSQPITLEAFMYGIYTGLLIMSMVFWFSSFHKTLGNDKFLYLFGRKLPQSSLLITMIMRFIPYFKLKLNEITMSQKTLGVSTVNGTLIQRMKTGSGILSALVSVTLEDTLETADSMTARGFALSNKTSRGFYKFKARDLILMIIATAICTLFMVFYLGKSMSFYFFPTLTSCTLSLTQQLVTVVYVLYFNLPLLILFMEELRWKFLKSKI
jgi:energy-coupling factor transport system permease protein